MGNFIIFGSHIEYSRWQPLHNHFIAYQFITYIQKLYSNIIKLHCNKT